MDSPRIVHVASEAYPLAKSGGLGDVVGALPAALERIGQKTAVFLPAYPWILAEHPEIEDLGVELDVPTGNGVVNLVTVSVSGYVYNSIVTYVAPATLNFNNISVTMRANL